MDTSPSELILLDGTVSSVIYRNEENGYTILRLEAPEAGEEVTVVGTMPGISPGEGLSVHGQWTRHSTYGEQFRAEIVERRMPVGEKALLEYLASGAVKGVGAAMARRLLDAFGEDVLTVIEEAPRRLTEVKGISPKRAETIHQSLCMQLSMRRLLDFLSAHGLSLSLAMPLYRRYGELALTASSPPSPPRTSWPGSWDWRRTTLCAWRRGFSTPSLTTWTTAMFFSPMPSF